MATITPPVPILDATPAMVMAVMVLRAAQEAEEVAAMDFGALSPQWRAARARIDRAWDGLEAAFPAGRVGWYPIGGKLWGRAKRDGTGLRLVEREAAWGMGHAARGEYMTGAAR